MDDHQDDQHQRDVAERRNRPFKEQRGEPHPGQQAGQKIDADRRPALVADLLQDPVMQMVEVRRHDAARIRLQQFADQPPPEGQRHVEERNPHRQHRNQKRSQRRRLAERGKSGIGEKQPEEHRTGVAHEDPGRREIVAKESRTASGENEGERHQPDRRLQNSGPEPEADRREQAQPRGDAVHSVDQIEGVDDRHHPEYGQRQCQKIGQFHRHDEPQPRPGHPDQDSGQKLKNQFGPARQRKTVVQQPADHDHRGRQREPGEKTAHFAIRAAFDIKNRNQEKRQDDRHASAARRRFLVNAPRIRQVHESGARQERDADPGQHQRKDACQARIYDQREKRAFEKFNHRWELLCPADR